MSKKQRRIRHRQATAATSPAAKLHVELLEDRSVPASLSGHVYLDVNGNGAFDAGDIGIKNAVVGLGAIVTYPDNPGVGTGYTAVATTDTNGAYRFDLGTGANTVFTLSETQPAEYKQGTNTLGTGNGTPNGDSFENIRLTPTQDSTGYDFGELAQTTVNNTTAHNNTNDNTNTNNNGGTNTNVNNNANGQSQTQSQSQNQSQTQSQGQSGANHNTNTDSSSNTNNNHGDPVPPAPLPPAPTPPPLSGYVYLDANNDGSRQGDAGLPGIEVQLVGAGPDGRLDTIDDTLQFTETRGDGSYSFGSALPPGIYRIVEQQPNGAPYVFADPTTRDVSYPAAGLSEQNFRATPVPPVTPAPASLSGTVYLDGNRNGTHDQDEAGVPGVSVGLIQRSDDDGDTSEAVPPRETTTGPDGSYSFPDLPGGFTYRVEELPLAGADITAAAGSLAGPGVTGNDAGVASGNAVDGIRLEAGVRGTGYDFAIVPVVPPPAEAVVPAAAEALTTAAAPDVPVATALEMAGPRFRYEPSWRGGVFVCTGDFDDADRDDVVVGHHNHRHRL